jgi:hypothetical protein
MAVRLPPQIGDRWRLNVVRVDYRSGGGSPGVASWNRIGYSDFHALDRMLNVVFADATGSITPKPAEPTPVAPETGSAGSAATGSAGSAATGSAGSAAMSTAVVPPQPAMIQRNQAPPTAPALPPAAAPTPAPASNPKTP